MNLEESWSDTIELATAYLSTNGLLDAYTLAHVYILTDILGVFFFILMGIIIQITVLEVIYKLAQFSELNGLSIWTYSLIFSGIGGLSIIYSLKEIMVSLQYMNTDVNKSLCHFMGVLEGFWSNDTCCVNDELGKKAFNSTTYGVELWICLIIAMISTKTNVQLFKMLCPIFFLQIMRGTFRLASYLNNETDERSFRIIETIKIDFDWYLDADVWLKLISLSFLQHPSGCTSLIMLFRCPFYRGSGKDFKKVMIHIYFWKIIRDSLQFACINLERYPKLTHETYELAIRDDKIFFNQGHQHFVKFTKLTPNAHIVESLSLTITNLTSFACVVLRYKCILDCIIEEIKNFIDVKLADTVIKSLVNLAFICLIISFRTIPSKKDGYFNDLLKKDLNSIIASLQIWSFFAFGINNMQTVERYVNRQCMTWQTKAMLLFTFCSSIVYIVLVFKKIFLESESIRVEITKNLLLVNGYELLVILTFFIIFSAFALLSNVGSVGFRLLASGKRWDKKLSEQENVLAREATILYKNAN